VTVQWVHTISHSVFIHVERFYNITVLVNVTLFIAYRRELSYWLKLNVATTFRHCQYIYVISQLCSNVSIQQVRTH